MITKTSPHVVRWLFILLAPFLAGSFNLEAGPATPPPSGYKTNYLVSDLPTTPPPPPSGYKADSPGSEPTKSARFKDIRLVNPWGVVVEANGTIWTADNGPGLITDYQPSGAPVKPAVLVPGPAGSTNAGTPSGLILNSTRHFVIGSGAKSHPATLLLCTEDGTIAGWNSQTKATNALIVVDNSTSNAVYKSLALAWTTNSTNLYVANFHSGWIEQYNSSFGYVTQFTDTNLTALGFAPFGMLRLQDKLFVTFAKQDAAGHDDVPGPGYGYIDIFNVEGELVRNFAAQGNLDSPWGMALAPRHFGKFSYALLVGNFGGSGSINAFNLITGEWLGSLEDDNGNVIGIPGLWGLVFSAQPGNDDLGYESSRLYFTAGPNGENDGLFGTIVAASPMALPIH